MSEEIYEFNFKANNLNGTLSEIQAFFRKLDELTASAGNIGGLATRSEEIGRTLSSGILRGLRNVTGDISKELSAGLDKNLGLTSFEEQIRKVAQTAKSELLQAVKVESTANPAAFDQIVAGAVRAGEQMHAALQRGIELNTQNLEAKFELLARKGTPVSQESQQLALGRPSALSNITRVTDDSRFRAAVNNAASAGVGDSNQVAAAERVAASEVKLAQAASEQAAIMEEANARLARIYAEQLRELDRLNQVTADEASTIESARVKGAKVAAAKDAAAAKLLAKQQEEQAKQDAAAAEYAARPQTFFAGFSKGLFSGGGSKLFGGVGGPDNSTFGDKLAGLGETSAIVAKYEITGRAVYGLTNALKEAVVQYADISRAANLYNVVAGDGAANAAFVNNLQSIAQVAGVNVVEALDEATRGVAAFSKETDSVAQKNQVATDFTSAVTKYSAVTGQTHQESSNQTIAIASSFDIKPDNLDSITNAVANAAKSQGASYSEIAQGLHLLSDDAKQAGYTMSETAQVIALDAAKTGESGQTIAQNLQRVFATIQSPQGKTDLLKAGVQVDPNGTTKQAIEALAAAYPKMDEAQKKVIVSELGGVRALKELLPLIQDNAQLQRGFADSLNNSDTGARAYAATVGSLAGQAKQLGEGLKNVVEQLAASGILTPFVVAFEGLKPVVNTVEDLLHLFTEVPAPIRESIALVGALTAAVTLLGSANAKAFAGSVIRGGATNIGNIATAGGLKNALEERSAKTAGTDALEASAAKTAATVDILGDRLAALTGQVTANTVAEEANTAEKVASDATNAGGFLSKFGANLKEGGANLLEFVKGPGGIAAAAVATAVLTDEIVKSSTAINHAFTQNRQAGNTAAQLNSVSTANDFQNAASGLSDAANNLHKSGEGFFGNIASFLKGTNNAAVSNTINDRGQAAFLNQQSSLIKPPTPGKIDFTTDIGPQFQALALSGEDPGQQLKTLGEALDSFTNTVRGGAEVLSSSIDQLNTVFTTLATNTLLSGTASGGIQNYINGLNNDITQKKNFQPAEVGPGVYADGELQKFDSYQNQIGVDKTQRDRAESVLSKLYANGNAKLNSLASFQEASNKQYLVDNGLLNKELTPAQVKKAESDAGAASLAQAKSLLPDVTFNPNDALSKFFTKLGSDSIAGIINASKESAKQFANSPEGIQSAIQAIISAATAAATNSANQAILGTPASVTPAVAPTFREQRLRLGGHPEVRQIQLTPGRPEQDISAIPGVTVEQGALINAQRDLTLQQNLLAKLKRDITSGADKHDASGRAQELKTLQNSVNAAAVNLQGVLASNTQSVGDLTTARINPTDQVAVIESQLRTALSSGTNQKSLANQAKVAQLQFQLVQSQVDAANKYADASIAVGDQVGLAFEKAKDIYRTASVEAGAQKASDLKNAAEAFSAAQVLKAQTDAAIALSKVDPRNIVGIARVNLAGDVAQFNATPKADVKARAELQTKIEQDRITLAQDQIAVANARIAAGVFPGSQLQTASATLREAANTLKNDEKNTAQYYTDLKSLHDAQIQYGNAVLASQNVAEQLATDQTNPVVQAQNALDAAKRKLAFDKKSGADKSTLQQDQLALTNAQNTEQSTQFNQSLQLAQTAYNLHQISGAAYLKYLESQRDQLLLVKNKTFQQVQELNQVNEAILSANQQLTGQFNLGDIKVPTIYQERRVAAQNGIDISSNSDNTFDVRIHRAFSPLQNAISAIKTDGAVQQLASLQNSLDALGSSRSTAKNSSVVNNITINGTDIGKVIDYLNQQLGKQALGSRTAVSTRKV